jgi:hypothetical protein
MEDGRERNTKPKASDFRPTRAAIEYCDGASTRYLRLLLTEAEQQIQALEALARFN